MSKSPTILPLAAALAALAGLSATAPDPTNAKTAEPTGRDGLSGIAAAKPAPNRIVTTGQALLGFTVNKAANGTVVAQHGSHVSHHSHHSHYSGN
jgi:hypothetical protein